MFARNACLLVLLVLLCACGEKRDTPELEIVAESGHRWTGVAVAKNGRIFVNFPRWSDDVPMSVAELVDGKPVAFPGGWDEWAPEKDAAKTHVCVQSVTVDDEGALWILDPANPKFAGVIKRGPKLSRHDLKSKIARIYRFDEKVALPNSYLNDVRVDTKTKTAYMTDSGAGGLVVLDLESGRSRRVLDGHASTMAEPIDITIEGKAWKRGGKTPQVHADGIGLSPDRKWVYYQALTGRTMYRVSTVALRDASLSAEALAKQVERVAESGVSDGLIFDAHGNLYLSSLEENAVNRLTPSHERALVVKDERLSWPDSFALGRDGWIYVTTAQIHQGDTPRDPFRVWRFKP